MKSGLNQNQSSGISDHIPAHSPSMRCLKSQQYGKKRMKIDKDVISPKRWFTEQTADVIITELRQLFPGMNVMQSLCFGDAGLSKTGGSSLQEESQKMPLSSQPCGLGQHWHKKKILKMAEWIKTALKLGAKYWFGRTKIFTKFICLVLNTCKYRVDPLEPITGHN